MRIRSIGGALPSPIVSQHCADFPLKQQSYRSPNSVDNETPTTLMVLPCICDQDWHLRILIENLLNSAIVDTLPGVLLACGAVFGLILGIAEVFGVSDVIGWFTAGSTARRRSGLLSIEFYLESETGPKAEALGRELTRRKGG